MMPKTESFGSYGDGITWYRGSMIGKGGFATVYIATLKNPKSKFSCYPPIFAVKSAEVSVSSSIQKETEILTQIKGCPYILKCYGDETTIANNGLMFYNLLLEYASSGSLSSRIQRFGSPCGLPLIEAKFYSKCILRGLKHIHQLGYVHCDLKPDNIFLFPNRKTKGGVKFKAKIGDFGLAKRVKQNKKRKLNECWEGTPMYLSPEAVVDKLQDCGSDIWAFGCIVVEMLTGKSMWDEDKEMSVGEILDRIKGGSGLVKIPDGISEEAKSFLKGCFAKKPSYRFTAEMLLDHPFLEGDSEEDEIQDIEEEIEDLNETESNLVESESENEWDFVAEDDLCYYSPFESNTSRTAAQKRRKKETITIDTLQVPSEGFTIRTRVGVGSRTRV